MKKTESMQGEKRDEKNRGKERQRNKWNGEKRQKKKVKYALVMPSVERKNQ